MAAIMVMIGLGEMLWSWKPVGVMNVYFGAKANEIADKRAGVRGQGRQAAGRASDKVTQWSVPVTHTQTRCHLPV
jgi:hypothetical protein